VLESAGQTLVIDPGGDPDLIIDLLGTKNVVGIVCTHCHCDHIGAVNELVSIFGAPVMIGRADFPGFTDLHLSGFDEEGVDYRITHAERLLDNGDKIRWGDDQLHVLDTPGHTPGSLCLNDYNNKLLFTGDTLFAGTVGQTCFPGGDPIKLNCSLARLKALDPEIKVLPGHGPSTSIGLEREGNPWLR
jgi:Zn-dependent hydrolases, including glyoxylases